MLAPDWALVRRVRRLIPRTRIHTMNKLLTLALDVVTCPLQCVLLGDGDDDCR